MSPRSASLLSVSASMLLAGCVSNLESKPATDAARGLRYALPQPVLKVEPQADGTMTLEVLYLPDPNNTYTVTASSLLGSYTLDVKTKEGLLDTVTFSPNGSTVVEALAASAGNIEKAKIDARSKADEAASKAAEAEAKAIAEAHATVVAARAKLARLKELKDGGGKVSEEQIVAAEVDLSVAEAKLANLGAAPPSLNLAANAPGADSAYPRAAGPVFFAMVPRPDGAIDLIASTPQIAGETAIAVPVAPKPITVVYQIEGSSVLRLGRDELVLRFKATPSPKTVIADDVELRDASGTALADYKVVVDLTSKDGQVALIATLPDDLPVGSYRLVVPVTGPDGGKQQPEAVRFEVRPKRPQ